jgi:hypothetical protein
VRQTLRQPSQARRDMESEDRILIGNPEGRHRRRWEHNIRMDLSEIWWEGVDWIYLAQDRNRWQAVVNTGMKLRFP